MVDLTPFRTVKRLRDTVDIMHRTTVEIFEAKKRALKEGNASVENQIERGRDIIGTLSM